MKPNVFRGLAAVVCAASTAACGGELSGEAAISNQEASPGPSIGGAPSGAPTWASTQDVRHRSGARRRRRSTCSEGPTSTWSSWRRTAQPLAVRAVAGPRRPLGHAGLTVDAPSGFALHELHADEDSSWLLRFPAGAPERHRRPHRLHRTARTGARRSSSPARRARSAGRATRGSCAGCRGIPATWSEECGVAHRRSRLPPPELRAHVDACRLAATSSQGGGGPRAHECGATGRRRGLSPYPAHTVPSRRRSAVASAVSA